MYILIKEYQKNHEHDRDHCEESAEEEKDDTPAEVSVRTAAQYFVVELQPSW